MLKKSLMYFSPIFLMHLNNGIRDCCFFLHSNVSNLHIFKSSWWDNDFPCPVRVLNTCIVMIGVFNFIGVDFSPPLTGGDYSTLGEVKWKTCHNASIADEKYALFNMPSSSTPKILIERSLVTAEPFKVKSKSYLRGPIGRACILALFINK